MNQLKKILVGTLAFLFVVLSAVSSRVEAAEEACVLHQDQWSLTIQKTDDGARFLKGQFGNIDVVEGEIFSLRFVGRTRRVGRGRLGRVRCVHACRSA